MKTLNRFPLNVFVLVLTVAFSALTVRPAFADGGTPPADTPATGAGSSSSGALASVPASPPGGAPKHEDGAKGKSSSLASGRAEAQGVGRDPQWCPSGVSPRNAATGGCSAPQASLSDLVGLISPVPHANGVIWIQSGPDGGGEVTINGTGNWAADQTHSLTLMGGWNGHNFSKGIDGISTFTAAINIVNWIGAVTINNITMSGVASNTAYPNTAALYVLSKGTITLKHVAAVGSGSGLRGALLNNLAAAGPKTVTVSAARFNGNGHFGLEVESTGIITLNGVTATYNADSGAYLDNAWLGSYVVSVKGTNNFTGNSGAGLEVFSNGPIKLSNITTSYNTGGEGGIIDNTTATKPQPVTVTGYLTAFGNSSDGMTISSRGNVSATNVTASDNGGDGVQIDNCEWNGSLCTGSGAVVIKGNSLLDYNTGRGLNIASRGAVTLRNLTAMHNSAGVFIDSCHFGSGPTCTGNPGIQSAVTISGSNWIAGNILGGLIINTYGAVTLNNLSAVGNFGIGAFVGNYAGTLPKPVTIKGRNEFSETDLGVGLSVNSRGAITISNITASDNGHAGMLLTNNLSPVQAKVTIRGYGVFEGNGVAGPAAGMQVISRGAITLSNITASANKGFGATLATHGISSPQPVTLKGTNNFDFNTFSGAGLLVQADGNIRISNITASHNGGDGATLDNGSLPTQAKITITGYGAFERNGFEGLHVTSHGAISLANINANYNGGNGAELSTMGLSGPQAVTLSGNNNFNSNGQAGANTGSGLMVSADGNIKISNITANHNNGDGAGLDNFTNWNAHSNPAFGFGSVAITGYGNFIGNVRSGLLSAVLGMWVRSHGSVTLNHITANENSAWGYGAGIGIQVDGNAKVVCSSAFGNSDVFGGYGLDVTLPSGHTLTLLGFEGEGNVTPLRTSAGVVVVNKPCP